MSTPRAAPEVRDFAELITSLRDQFLSASPTARRITFIFGAGVSIALAEQSRHKQATWKGLLEVLFKGVNPYFKGIIEAGPPSERDMRQKAERLRKKKIRSLSEGDSDMIVAMTYIIDRIHRQCRGGSTREVFRSKGWQHDVNKLMGCIEKDAGKEPAWAGLMTRLGGLARQGRTLLATTNFDHTVATLTRLPVYLMPQDNDGFSGPAEYASWREGLVIPVAELAKSPMMSPWEVEEHLMSTLPSPAAYRRAWTRPASVSRDWFQDLASVLHIHGSRRVPPSLVFDPVSYDAVDTGSSIQNLLQNLVKDPIHSGAIIFVGCKGTLFDPHFIKYWQGGSVDHIYCLAQEAEAEEISRMFYLPTLGFPPRIVSYGSDYGSLPFRLNDILDTLP